MGYLTLRPRFDQVILTCVSASSRHSIYWLICGITFGIRAVICKYPLGY